MLTWNEVLQFQFWILGRSEFENAAFIFSITGQFGAVALAILLLSFHFVGIQVQ